MEGHYYLLKAYIYDRDKNPITMTDNLVIENMIDKEYFEVIRTNLIKSEVVIKAIKATSKGTKIILTSFLKQVISRHRSYTYQVE